MVLGLEKTMQRWFTVALGALLIVVLGALAWRGGRGDHGKPSLVPPYADTSAEVLLPPTPMPKSDAAAPQPDAAVPVVDRDAGAATDDSLPSVSLPHGSPKTIHFGVVLVRYRGAEGSAPTERSKQEASLLARSLAEAAQVDFRGAVSRGDQGSMEDAGRMPRGVLDPVTEYTLFTLRPGEVTPPIDTPRGFWILRRID